MTDQSPPYMSRLFVQRRGCIQRMEVKLTRLHALVGPNDSGKTTTLNAITESWTVSAQPTVVRPLSDPTNWFDARVHAVRGSPEAWVAEFRTGAGVRALVVRSNDVRHEVSGSWSPGPMRKLHLRPSDLRQPGGLVPFSEAVLGETGSGLSSALDAILARSRVAFGQIEDALKEKFPSIETLMVPAVSGRKQVAVLLKTGVEVSAQQLSDGVLYYLAFLVMQQLSRPGLLLIEEPENGLHPARIADVVRVLREISKTTQVVMATHSPLVINELGADEISIITRPPDKGTQAILLKDTADYERRSKTYSNGELWLSYGDGLEEKALIEGGPRP